ncbi:MAG: polyphosphate kinase 1 [Clostridiales bacterium]|nr:polyphosphate kinase 1 [Clostridiales bacterium]
MKQKILPYLNRELSWLKFNERVLEEAEDKSVPLCERLTFLSIFQSNLDEFIRVRVGSLADQMVLQPEMCDNKTGMTSKEQLEAVFSDMRKLLQRKDYTYKLLMNELKTENISIVNFNMLSQEESDYLEQYFNSEIAPLLSPMLISKSAPFPFLKNNDIYAAVLLGNKNKKDKVGIIPCSNNVFQRLIKSPFRKGTFILSEELILHFVEKVYPHYVVKSKTLLKITRNADIDADDLYDDELDYRDIMTELIKRRKKLSPLTMSMTRNVDEQVVVTLCENLGLQKENIFYSESPLDFRYVFQIQDELRKKAELFYQKRIPQASPMFDMKKSIMEQIAERDRMLSFPYESIRPFIALLREAAIDPEVLSVKMTLYRVARNSKIVEALVEAAENGKEVTVLVELRARFDEENNIEWSRRLEHAGCNVIYGLPGYKVHSKLCLITRKHNNEIQYFTQVGTGNYNEKTAELYTDLMVMTANQEIGENAGSVFQALILGEVVEKSEKLLVAPKCLQNKVLEMIDEEIMHAKQGEGAYIGLKMNSLTDKKIIDKLIEASQAGVKIDMVIRGICCLAAGVPGYTENIQIRSIVGRFLEHSRIYMFGTPERRKMYIASADFMTRNTVKRVEVAVPVETEELRMRLEWIFVTMLSDNVKTRIMKPDGLYEKLPIENAALNSQELFFQEAYRENMKSN